MWSIIRAEFLYHKFLFLICLGLTPLAILWEAGRPEDAPGPGFILWILMFLTVNTWVSLQIKERRELLYLQSPLPVWQTALARLMVIVLTCLGIGGSYALIHLAAGGTPPSPGPLLFLTTSILFIYSLVFIVRDQVTGRRYLGNAKLWIMLGLALMVAGNLYFLFLAREVMDTGKEPPVLIKALPYLITNHPFSTATRTMISIMVTLALAAVSIWTFSRRTTHVA